MHPKWSEAAPGGPPTWLPPSQRSLRHQVKASCYIPERTYSLLTLTALAVRRLLSRSFALVHGLGAATKLAW